MGARNSLEKYSALEFGVPVSGGKSEEFLFQNQKCFFNFCKYDPMSTAKRALTLESESKVPLSFGVNVHITTAEKTLDTHIKTFRTDFAPYEIWSCTEEEASNLGRNDTLSLRVMFMNVSNQELIVDANVKTEKKQRRKRKAGSPSSLKKETCLCWVLWMNENSVNMRSPRFVFGDRRCFFRGQKRLCPEDLTVINTLTIDSDTKAPLLFDVTIHICWGFGQINDVVCDSKTIECIPPYDIWTSEPMAKDDPKTRMEITYFRVIFSNCSNIDLIEDIGVIACPPPPPQSSAREQFTQTPSYLNLEDISLRNLSSDLRKLLLSDDSKPDVSIQCGGCTIPAHRNILATRSEVLKTMMAESDTGILQIVDMEASVCRKFIEYLYTASLTDLSVELALSLHEAGKKYAVDSLQRHCSDFLKESLSDEEVLGNIIDKDEILNSSQWVCFCESQPNLVVRVFQRAYKKAKNLK